MVRTATGAVAFRYVERHPKQALLQKLARQVSGLHALNVLLASGLVQEQCVMQRVLDEIGEDIGFITVGLAAGKWTALHDRFLAGFWEEEFDGPTALQSSQKRDTPNRTNIRAQLARLEGLPHDPSTLDNVGRTIHKAYSGYVHASSPQIMDLVGGMPPRFHLSGMLGTSRMDEHTEDAANYFYRGLLSATLVAKVFGEGELTAWLLRELSNYQTATGLPDASVSASRLWSATSPTA
jgi:hypothetical protein